MDEVLRLLLGGEVISGAQISERLGFSSVSYFSAQFRKAVGQTPTDYRNRRNEEAVAPRKLQADS